MTTVAILPTTENGQRIYRATLGDKHAIGKTAGEALDALTKAFGDDFPSLLLVQSFRPDRYFGVAEQQRLSELMNLWRDARDKGETFSPALQAELDMLVEAELVAATARTAKILQQLEP